MRLTDLSLFVLLAFAIYAANDPAAASDLLDHLGAQLRTWIP